MNSSNNAGNYNLSQLMVTAAAREICDGEVVFVGMRLPQKYPCPRCHRRV